MTGTIEAIYVAAGDGEPLRTVERAVLTAGAGIAGDRYYGRAGKPGRNVTLIEAEAIERFNADYRANAPLGATRRNIVTRGIRLNDLVGREFLIGGVRALGIELCEPCSILGANLATPAVDKAAVVRAFVHRAGLRADLLSSGEVAVGDPVAAAGQGIDQGVDMDKLRIVGVVLVIAGALGLAYGSFSYTKQRTEAKIGPIEVTVAEKETVNVPQWAGVGAVVAGAALLLAGWKR
jgi:hypothetical protein